ncbi:hypothetical protein ACFW5V_32445 [Streptomyces sp. NPDC058762]|uniref:hypothetical protein n=1 Tax=Streptomyces sp. NPDC058762 TaxID=3346629 RepID=UPI0036A49E75
MTPSVTTPARPGCLALALAEQVAALLPARAGTPWTAAPGTAWWTTKPTARLAQNDRTLILVWHPWHTEIAWQLPGREPHRPDLRTNRLSAGRVAREVLRLVLPVLDDEAAHARQDDAARARLELLTEIGAAMRAQGAATYERGGLLRNTSTVTWASSGLRYSATLHGSNPIADVQIEGPVRAVERATAHFLPEPPEMTPYRPVRDVVRGRIQRRMAAFLRQYVDVEQTEQGGLAFGTRPGVYGYAAPALDPAARVRDTSPASVDIHGVGVDFLVSLAPYLAR